VRPQFRRPDSTEHRADPLIFPTNLQSSAFELSGTSLVGTVLGRYGCGIRVRMILGSWILESRLAD
jgi:hypothetical protein